MTNGLKIAVIGNASWKSFIGNDFKLVDFSLIKNLSLIDEYKVAYDNQVKRMSDFIFSNMRSAQANDKEIFLIIMNDLVFIEEKMLEVHEAAAKILKNNN